MTKKHSLTRAYLIAVAAFVLVVNLLLGVILTKQSSNAMKDLIRSRMLDITNTAASMIDGDDLEKLTAEDAHTPEYREILRTLTYYQDSIDLEYIYCIKDNGDRNFTFSVDPTVEDPGEFGEPIVYTDALYEASLGQAAVDEEPYLDKWGRFYSAYSPVFDSRGDVAGIVAVDFDAGWYDKQVYGQIWTIVIITILSLSFAMVIVLMIVSRSRKRVRSLMGELNNLSDGIETLANELSEGRRLEGAELLQKDTAGRSLYDDELNALSEKIRSLQEYMSVQIGYVRSKAYRDGLTGLENRTAYLEFIVEINEQIGNNVAQFSVAMFDINGLKDINDRNGHDRGDKEIICAAEILKDVFSQERIFRIGGDEFVVIISRDGETAKTLMDECRRKISESHSGDSRIIMSTGYAEYDRASDSSYQDTFDRADRLMYVNKKAFYESSGNRRKQEEK